MVSRCRATASEPEPWRQVGFFRGETSRPNHKRFSFALPSDITRRAKVMKTVLLVEEGCPISGAREAKERQRQVR